MQRPRIQPKKTKSDIVIEAITFFLVLISALLISLYYSDLPEKIQVSFNWPSKSDQGMVNKSILWISPLISGIVIIALYILNRFPWIFNYPVKVTETNAIALYRIANQFLRSISLTVALICITFTLRPILATKGSDVSFLGILPPIFVIILFGLIILTVIRMMRNSNS